MQLLIMRGLFWLISELFLSTVELDQLADYSEFIFRLKDDMSLQRNKVVALMKPERGLQTECSVPFKFTPAGSLLYKA